MTALLRMPLDKATPVSKTVAFDGIAPRNTCWLPLHRSVSDVLTCSPNAVRITRAALTLHPYLSQ